MINEIDFVEKYYPNYYSSSEITRWNDLQSLIDEDYVKESSAYKLLMTEFGGDYQRAYPSILRAHTEVSEKIYKEAILGYIETKRKKT